MKLNYLLLLFFLSAYPSFCQTSGSGDFQEIAQQIERLLQYRDKSPTELQTLLNRLERVSNGNELMFKQIKLQVEHYLLPLELKSIKSNIHNKNFTEASRALNVVKKKYSFTKEIADIEKSLNSAMYKHYRRILLQDIHPLLSIEPTYAWYSEPYSLEGLEQFDFVNFSPHYNISANYLFGYKSVSNSGNYDVSYNQIGIKIEWRDDSQIYLPSNPESFSLPNRNVQITSIRGKFLGLDMGMYSPLANEINRYNGTLSFYIPLGMLSLGVHGRAITDLTNDPVVQLGASARLVYDFFRPFTSKHREEIEMRIFRFKESN